MDKYIQNKKYYIDNLKIKKKYTSNLNFLHLLNDYYNIDIYYNLISNLDNKQLFNLYNYIYIYFNKIIINNKLNIDNIIIKNNTGFIDLFTFNKNINHFIENTNVKNKECLCIFIINSINNFI